MKLALSETCASSWHAVDCTENDDLSEMIFDCGRSVELQRKEFPHSDSSLEIVASNIWPDARELILICSARIIEVYLQSPSDAQPSYACTVKASACMAHGVHNAFTAAIQLDRVGVTMLAMPA